MGLGFSSCFPAPPCTQLTGPRLERVQVCWASCFLFGGQFSLFLRGSVPRPAPDHSCMASYTPQTQEASSGQQSPRGTLWSERSGHLDGTCGVQGHLEEPEQSPCAGCEVQSQEHGREPLALRLTRLLLPHPARHLGPHWHLETGAHARACPRRAGAALHPVGPSVLCEECGECAASAGSERTRPGLLSSSQGHTEERWAVLKRKIRQKVSTQMQEPQRRATGQQGHQAQMQDC